MLSMYRYSLVLGALLHAVSAHLAAAQHLLHLIVAEQVVGRRLRPRGCDRGIIGTLMVPMYYLASGTKHFLLIIQWQCKITSSTC